MLGELYLPAEMPEPPKESFFKGLFGGLSGGGARSVDREELCKSKIKFNQNEIPEKKKENGKLPIFSSSPPPPLPHA